MQSRPGSILTSKDTDSKTKIYAEVKEQKTHQGQILLCILMELLAQRPLYIYLYTCLTLSAHCSTLRSKEGRVRYER